MARTRLSPNRPSDCAATGGRRVWSAARLRAGSERGRGPSQSMAAEVEAVGETGTIDASSLVEFGAIGNTKPAG